MPPKKRERRKNPAAPTCAVACSRCQQFCDRRHNATVQIILPFNAATRSCSPRPKAPSRPVKPNAKRANIPPINVPITSFGGPDRFERLHRAGTPELHIEKPGRPTLPRRQPRATSKEHANSAPESGPTGRLGAPLDIANTTLDARAAASSERPAKFSSFFPPAISSSTRVTPARGLPKAAASPAAEPAQTAFARAVGSSPNIFPILLATAAPMWIVGPSRPRLDPDPIESAPP